MERSPSLHLLHLQRHARRAGRPGAERLPGAPASRRGTPPPPAGGGAALGRDGGGVWASRPAVSVRGVSQPDDGGDPGGAIRPGAPQACSPWPAAVQLGKITELWLSIIFYIYILKALMKSCLFFMFSWPRLLMPCPSQRWRSVSFRLCIPTRHRSECSATSEIQTSSSQQKIQKLNPIICAFF